MAFKASCETKMVDINTGKILQHTCLEDYTTADNEVFASGIEGPGCTSANNPANGEYATAGSGCSTAMLSSGCGTFVAGAPECQVSWIYSDDPTASTEPASCSTNGGTVVNP